jgi:putative oxidoreductase
MIGAFILGAYFLYSGVHHFVRANDMIGYAKYKGMPMPEAAVYASGIVLALGGLGLILQRYLVWSYIGLIVFLVIAAVTMHDFWKQTDAKEKMTSTIQFQKNIALAAALLMLLAPLL